MNVKEFAEKLRINADIILNDEAKISELLEEAADALEAQATQINSLLGVCLENERWREMWWEVKHTCDISTWGVMDRLEIKHDLNPEAR